jgi:hypothetical protein
MDAVKKIQAGQYSVSDGRYIVKDGAGWYVLNSDAVMTLGHFLR